MKHKDRVAIVTGSAQGIGKAIAEKLAAEGAAVVLADLNEAGAKEVAAHLPKAIAIRTDVSDEASVKAMVQAAVDAFGKLDILVNNAAIVPSRRGTRSTSASGAGSWPSTWTARSSPTATPRTKIGRAHV